MGLFFYTIFTKIYLLGIRLTAYWNPKARKWIAGRSDIFARMQTELMRAEPPAANGNIPTIWMHCSSLGEFEQGRPLLEALRKQYPECRTVLSFFSPSGYEVIKDQPAADHIFYLPMDSPQNARRFISLVKPTLVLWVKYDFWYYYLMELSARKIPLLLVSGIFRPSQPFFKWYGAIWKKMLDCFTQLFVQNKNSAELLETISLQPLVAVSGDTRFDRVLSIAQDFTELPGISAFCNGYPVLVAGSTWDEDEVELLHFVNNNPQLRFIIAPHEIDPENLADLRRQFPASLFYSELGSKEAATGKHVLIIDNIGMLSRLYRYATVTYVGGGFGEDGVHNVLEAAVYGKPVVFGPVFHKYDEAVGLREAGGAVSASGPLELEAMLEQLFMNQAEREKMGQAARKFVQQQAGATGRIMEYIQAKRLLTS
ncbi:MAG: glycosyltransferase N-terminal domain-containing protein [Ferruginibacter sp.]